MKVRERKIDMTDKSLEIQIQNKNQIQKPAVARRY